MEVRDGDFESLLAWDSDYAWQIMVQALTCGSDTAHLVYFTDRLPIIEITDSTRVYVQRLIDDIAVDYSEQYGYPWSYNFVTGGFFYVARSFSLTDEIREHILGVLDRATRVCETTIGSVITLLKQG